jgi:hypothetical protein
MVRLIVSWWSMNAEALGIGAGEAIPASGARLPVQPAERGEELRRWVRVRQAMSLGYNSVTGTCLPSTFHHFHHRAESS